MGMKKRPDKMIICSCVSGTFSNTTPTLKNCAGQANKDCAKCKGTGKVRQRTNKTHIAWEGSDGQPIRIVLVDADTTLTLPCKVIIERGSKDAAGKRNWSDLNNTNNLEKRLGWELGKALGGMPHWALEPEDEIKDLTHKTGAYR